MERNDVSSVSGTNKRVTGSGGSSVKGVLFFLFALAVCFGYFYFFTDVLRSKEEPPGQSGVYTLETKKPLPQRLVQGVATSSGVTEKTSADILKPEAKKNGPASGVLSPAKKNAADPSKTDKAKIKTEKNAAISKKDTVAKIAKAPVKAPGKKKAVETRDGSFTLAVGTYVLKSSMLADKMKLEKAGLRTFVCSGKRIDKMMHRVLVVEAATYAAAQRDLEKVKRVSKDAFLLKEKGAYTVYAGSYYSGKRALQEQKRLQGNGLPSVIRMSLAPVSAYSLTVGRYPSRDAALAAAEGLTKIGFKPYPVSLKK